MLVDGVYDEALERYDHRADVRANRIAFAASRAVTERFRLSFPKEAKKLSAESINGIQNLVAEECFNAIRTDIFPSETPE